ncbi:hypothetical protein CS537_09510 [Yersinia mollaretii]|nr:hypothetical protein CS537_09510 [Yersinia mollaretii]
MVVALYWVKILKLLPYCYGRVSSKGQVSSNRRFATYRTINNHYSVIKAIFYFIVSVLYMISCTYLFEYLVILLYSNLRKFLGFQSDSYW